MMSTSRLSLILWLLAVAALWPAWAAEPVAAIKAGVVKIIVTAPTSKVGAGIVVRRDRDEAWIVTAAHVVAGADKIAVKFPDSARLWTPEVSHIEYENPAQGLALLKATEALPAEVVALPLETDVILSREQEVAIIGHQASVGDWGVLSGVLSGRKGRELVIQAPIQEQTSGGPVILNGRVVGMVQRRDPSGQFGYAVTAQAIREYVAGNQPTAAPGETFRDCEQCPEMVVIPGGKFMTGGSTEWEAYNYRELAAARPQHEVTIRGPLAVGKYKITRDEWDACVAARVCPNHRIRSADQGKSPIFDMTWFEAQAYVSWLAKKTGKPYRLLSEAEWEYAARAGSKEQTAPAGSLEPNRFGLHGMLDHVGEWVQDCWHETYYGAPTDGSAWESGACTERVVRSRYYELSHSMTSDKKARIAWRAPYKPGYRYDQEALGLRVARTL